LNRILLGDNPFIGVNHLSQDAARNTLSRLDTEKIAKVMLASFESGADGFVFSTHPTDLSVFRYLREKNPDISFGLYPLFPYAQGYVRAATEKGMVGLIGEMMQQMSWGGRMKALVGGGLSTVTMNPFKMLETFVDIEIDSFLKVSPPKSELKSVFLHEIIVDLALSLQMNELFERYIDHVNSSYHVKAGLVTRNFARMVEYFEQSSLPFDKVIFMTPFNKIGFQMNPSREACEKALKRRPDIDVIAMSVLSAGLLRVEEAIEYIGSVPNLESVVVGVSSVEHARTTFAALKRFSDSRLPPPKTVIAR
jgi:hypothetical protein